MTSDLVDLARRVNRSGLLFAREDGSAFQNYSAANKAIKRMCRRAALRPIGWHTRHTFASQLALAGVPIIAVQQLLGHASVTTTMRYAHLAPSGLRHAIDTLEQHIAAPCIPGWARLGATCAQTDSNSLERQHLQGTRESRNRLNERKSRPRGSASTLERVGGVETWENMTASAEVSMNPRHHEVSVSSDLTQLIPNRDRVGANGHRTGRVPPIGLARCKPTSPVLLHDKKGVLWAALLTVFALRFLKYDLRHLVHDGLLVVIKENQVRLVAFRGGSPPPMHNTMLSQTKYRKPEHRTLQPCNDRLRRTKMLLRIGDRQENL